VVGASVVVVASVVVGASVVVVVDDGAAVVEDELGRRLRVIDGDTVLTTTRLTAP
jgi:hypothetical protein